MKLKELMSYCSCLTSSAGRSLLPRAGAVRAFALAVALCTVGLAAQAANVAKIGGTEYPSIAAACGAVANGETIELLADAPVTANLDLTGKTGVTITGSDTYCLTATVSRVTLDFGDNTYDCDLATGDDCTFVIVSGKSTYANEFTGPNILIEKWTQFEADQYDYLDPDAKPPLDMVYDMGADGQWHYFAYPEEEVVAERESDRMQYNDLATAFAVVRDGQTIRLLTDVREDVTVTNTVTFDMQGYLLDGAITAANTDQARTNTLKNVNMTGKITAAGNLRVIVENGTNAYDQAFVGTNIELMENVVVGYKQSANYVSAAWDYAQVESNRWQAVNTNRLEAMIGRTGNRQVDQVYLTAEDAVRLAPNGALVEFLADRAADIVLDQEAIDKNLLFNPTNVSPDVTFTGTLKAAPDVTGTYKVAQTAEGYLFLTPDDTLVARLDNGVVYTNIATAVAAATNGATVTLLKTWTEDVSIADKALVFDLAGNWLTGTVSAASAVACTNVLKNVNMTDDISATGDANVVFETGTNTYSTAEFAGPNVELMAGTFSYEHKNRVTDGRILANNVTTPPTWTVVYTNDIVAVVDGQLFTSFEKAIDYAYVSNKTVIAFNRSYDQAGETNIVFTSDMAMKAVSNKLEFDPAGFAFPGALVADNYVTAMNKDRRLYLAPEADIVAKIGERLAFTNIADAVAVSTNGAMVTLLKDWTENVTVSDNKTNSFSFGAFELNGDLKATGAADKIVVLDGTNIYENAFTGTNLEFAEDTVFGYKQSRDYIADDLAMAKVEENRWKVAHTNRLMAASNGEKFLSLEDAARLADNGAVIDLLTNRVDTLKLTQTEIDKNLLFNTNGFAFLSSPYLAKADDVDGDYAVAQTAEGYYYLTPASNVVAMLDNGTLYTNVAAAVKMAVDGDMVTLLTNWTENVTVNGQTNSFKFGAFEFNGNLTTDAAGKIVVVDFGTNAYASAFTTGANLELQLNTTYGFKQAASFLPSDEYALAKMAANRWTVVKTNDLAAAIGNPADYATYQVFTSPKKAIELAAQGDTITFLKPLEADLVVDAAGLAKNLKFHPGSLDHGDLRIKADGYKLVQLPDRTFTLEPLGYVAKIVATRDMKFKTFLAAMTYAAPRTERIIEFLQDYPDNILVPDDMMDKGFEFDTAGYAFDGTLYATDPAYVQAMNGRGNIYLAPESDIVARIGDDLVFTNVADAASVATNGATVTVTNDFTGAATALTDITLETEGGAVYGGPFFNGGHSVKTTLGSLFGTNLIEELDWTDTGLTLINQTNGTWKVCPAATAMAQIRWTNRPTEVFDSVQSAFAWLRKFVDENPAEALNTYGIDVIGGGEHALDLAGQQLNWSINVSNETSTTTVTNGEIRGNFTAVKGDGGTVVFGAGVRMNDETTVFKAGSGVKLVVKAGAYVNDPTEFCEPGHVGALRAKPDLANKYVIYTNSEVQVSMTDQGGHVIHFRELQDAFDLAKSVISPLPNPAEIRLCNNLADLNATNRADDANFVLIGDPNGANGPAMNVNGGRIVVEDGLLSASNLSFNAAQIVVKGANGCIFTAGDDLEIKNATDGAVVVESGAKMVVDGKNIRIWDNNGTNVVVRNPATGLVLVRDDDGTAASGQKSRIGIWCENCAAGQQFGTVDSSFPYPFYCDGDITVEEPQVYFTNDRAPKLHHGRGAAIDRSLVYEGTNSVRWVGGFAEALFEGHALITRTGDELVWLAATNPPPADPVEVVGRTAHTLSFVAEKGCDYAVVTNGIADTNWVSITDATLGLNGNDGTFTFTNLAQFVNYTFLKRYSITESTMISSNVTIGVETTSSEDIDELIRDFGFNPDRNLWKEFLDIAPDGNYPYDGYIVTLKKDIAHGAVLPDDVGRLVIRLDGHFLSAEPGKNGIDFRHSTEEPFLREYRDQLQANVSVLGGGRIVGGKPTSGTDATHGAEGTLADKTPALGGIGICASGCEGVILTLEGGVQVIGGGYLKNNDGVEFGNGGFGINLKGGDGVDGQPGIDGNVTNLIVRGAYVKGGAGGNGGSSTHGNGGNGGDGAAALGADVVVTVLEDATFEGGAGGRGGDSGATDGAAGKGGNGGTALDPQFASLAEGDCAFTGGDAGKGGVGHNGAEDGEAGERGSSGKPAAPANDVEVQAVTGETIQFTAEPYMIYDLYEGDALVMSYTNDTADVVTARFGEIDGDVKANTAYTIRSRYTANEERDEAESFERVTSVTTTFWTAEAIVEMFDGKADVELDGDGNYSITLTDNVNGTVPLPEKLGKVTLDLAGFEVVGTDGASGVPAQDGSAAIVIVASTDVDPLSGGALNPKDIDLTLTGDGELVGGNGGDSLAENPQDAQQGGAGAPAIANATGNAGLISVTLDGPTLRGGNGGNGCDALTGNGGAGGDGGDAVGSGIVIDYVSGRVIGGNGGAGGEARDKTADVRGGNGGVGGTANVCDTNGDFVANTQGGNGGSGGNGPTPGNLNPDGSVINNAGAGATWGVPGSVLVDEGGDEDVEKPVLVRVGDASVPAVRYYLSLEDAVASLNDNEVVTVFRDCTLENDVEVLADYVRLTTENGAKITLNADIAVPSSLTLRIGGTCDFGEGIGEIDVSGQVVTLGGSNVCATVEKGGVLTPSVGMLGSVTVMDGGKFVVEYESDVRVTGKIEANNKKNVLLLGGLYDQDPTAFLLEWFTTEGENPWKVVVDPQYEGTITVGDETKAFTSLTDAFAEVRKAKVPVVIRMLQDATVDEVLLDENKVDVTIYGYGKTLTDARTEEASEAALFNLSGNVTLIGLNVDGAGQKGDFIRLFEAKDITLEGCTITGYDCQGVDGPVPLIWAYAAGAKTRLFVYDTTITGNACSAAIDTTDRSGSGFTYPVHVKGATTITGNTGKGIYSDGYGQIVMDGNLTGGVIDVFYPGFGGFPGKFATANGVYTGVENFLFTDLKTCGKILEENGRYFVKWDNDPRQWAAEVVDNGGASQFYETVEEALGEVGYNGRVILHQDCTIAEAVDVSATFVLDLNGKTLTNDANLLKFLGGIAVVSNGTLTAATSYALYVNNATVRLGDALTVEGDAYVAKGWLAAVSAGVGVKGAFKRTTNGKIELTEGRYVNDPTAYLTVGRATCAIDEDGYNWTIIAKESSEGFADDFKPEVVYGEEKTEIDLASGGVGKILTGSSIELDGDQTDRLDVTLPTGWLVKDVVYDDASGKTTVTFKMDEETLKPVISSEDPGKRPLVFDIANGTISISVKNAAAGFVYYIIQSDTPDFATVKMLDDSKVRATADGPIAVTGTFQPAPSKFFKVCLSDKW